MEAWLSLPSLSLEPYSSVSALQTCSFSSAWVPVRIRDSRVPRSLLSHICISAGAHGILMCTEKFDKDLSKNVVPTSLGFQDHLCDQGKISREWHNDLQLEANAKHR